VEREPRVGDPLAAGPADLGEDVGDRLGQHDVAGPRDEPPPERPPASGPGVQRDDDLVGEDRAGAFGGGRRHPPGLEPLDARPLVDHDAALERDAPQPASERGRLHRPGPRHERAGAEHGRSGVAGDLVAR
jgi:hypothetical protein